MAEVEDLLDWARSGAMALTGPASGPPDAGPVSVAASARLAAADLAATTQRWGRRVVVDGPRLLGERAALAGLSRQGSTSVGGAASFVRVANGYIVLNLPRPEDVAALPALVEADVSPDDWRAIRDRLLQLTAREATARAVVLGLAVAQLGERSPLASPGCEILRGGPRRVRPNPLVVDVSSLWAGPLAASLLNEAGARVIKVEGVGRSDGARRGPAAFFDLLNAGKEMVSIDFSAPADIGLLKRLLRAADLVIEGSRPRVMERLGIAPAELAAAGTSWLSFTGHGRQDEAAHRIGFGDDAAVAGGLFLPASSVGEPCFVADAVADPLAGLVGAKMAAEVLGSNRAVVVEAPLSRVAAWATAPHVAVAVTSVGDHWEMQVDGQSVVVAEPSARVSGRAAAPPDGHGANVRAEFAATSSRRPRRSRDSG